MLPKNLKYGTKIESAVARSMRTNIAPQNGTGPYGLGDTIILNIPTRNNLVLVPTESYLKFNVTLKSGAAANAFRWDSAGAHGLVQKLSIFHGSNLIQQIDSYGMLAKMLFDLQQPTDAVYGKQTVLSGTRSDTVGSFPAIATADGNSEATNSALANALKAQFNTVGRGFSSYQVNSGERIGGDLSTLVANDGTVTETYCLNLVSLIGSLCFANYIPLFAMTSAPLRVEIQLVDNVNKACACLTGGNNNSFSITNCEYVANMIELGDSAMSVIYGNLGGEPLQFVVPDFRNYQFTQTLTTATQTQVTFPIPAKFSSLKSILISIRDKGTGTATFFPFSSVTSGFIEYQFRVGATVMPPKAPTMVAECFSEVLKAMGSIGDINYQPSIDKRSYSLVASVASNDTATAVSTTSSGAFYIGLDLENYSSAPKDTIFAGYNTNTDDIFAQITLNQTTGGNVSTRFDAFANFDCVVVCENNTAYVKF
jgi:hypothetical protein